MLCVFVVRMLQEDGSSFMSVPPVYASRENFRVRARARQHSHNARCAQKLPAGRLDRIRLSICGTELLRGNVTQLLPVIILNNHKPPWGQLAMIGHARCNRQKRFECGGVGAGVGHIARQHRAPLSQKIQNRIILHWPATPW